jgi:hypothetical protein
MSDTDLAVLALGDMLCAAADDLAIPLSSRDARRVAPHVVELLGVAGWQLVPTPERAA